MNARSEEKIKMNDEEIQDVDNFEYFVSIRFKRRSKYCIHEQAYNKRKNNCIYQIKEYMELEQHQQKHQAQSIQIISENCVNVWRRDVEDEQGGRKES